MDLKSTRLFMPRETIATGRFAKPPKTSSPHRRAPTKNKHTYIRRWRARRATKSYERLALVVHEQVFENAVVLDAPPGAQSHTLQRSVHMVDRNARDAS